MDPEDAIISTPEIIITKLHKTCNHRLIPSLIEDLKSMTFKIAHPVQRKAKLETFRFYHIEKYFVSGNTGRRDIVYNIHYWINILCSKSFLSEKKPFVGIEILLSVRDGLVCAAQVEVHYNDLLMDIKKMRSLRGIFQVTDEQGQEILLDTHWEAFLHEIKTIPLRKYIPVQLTDISFSSKYIDKLQKGYYTMMPEAGTLK